MPRPSARLITAIGVTMAAVGVALAAGMTWGRHTVEIPLNLGGGIGEFETTGWAGRLILGPFWLPNWLVVFASGIVCWCSWLRLAGFGRIPAMLPIAFGLYGLAHAGAVVFVFTGIPNARLGPGAPLALLGFVAMLVLMAVELRSTSSGRRSRSA